MDDALVLAFERAAGRDSGIEPVARVLGAFARRVVEAGRRVAVLPVCPSALLRRAIDLFHAPAERGSASAVWRLLFDSWREIAPATRGPRHPRFLRFGGRGGSLDVEMVTDDGEAVRLRGTVDGPAGPLVLEIAPRLGQRVRVPVRAGGAFAASLPAGAKQFTLALRSGRRTLSRTGRIPPLPSG